MRAAYYDRVGDPHDVLILGKLPDPVPGPGDVRVRVMASGLNPSDIKKRAGWGAYAHMQFPRIVPHNDGAGVIDTCGDGVPSSRLGERVWIYEAQRHGRPFGTAADYVVVPSSNAVSLPDGISFSAGAALGVPAMTAHRCLFRDGPINDQTILVAGGAGSVGMFAIQLARWGGARVIATAGSEVQMDLARKAGAEAVFSYASPDLVGEVQRHMGGEGTIDRIVEVAFAANVDRNTAMLRPNGVIATYANTNDPDDRPFVPFQSLSVKCVSIQFVLVYEIGDAAHEHAAKDIVAALQAAALRPKIAATYQLDDIAEAHSRVGISGTGGKVVLDLAH